MAEYTKEELDGLIKEIKGVINQYNNPNSNFDFEQLDEKWNELLERWSNANSEQQSEQIDEIISLFNLRKVGYDFLLTKFLSKISPEVQEEGIERIIDKINKNEMSLIEYGKICEAIWNEMCPKAQEKIENKLLECNFDEIKILLSQLSQNLQEKMYSKTIDKFKGNDFEVIGIYSTVNNELQEKVFDEIVDVLKNKLMLTLIWEDTKPEIRLQKFESTCTVLKEQNIEKYRGFVQSYLGDVEFDKDNNPIIPEELKLVIFNPKDKEQAEEVEKNLASIIKNWESIKRHIQYTKANSIKNDDIEIRANIEQILKSNIAIHRVPPLTPSAQEFENIPEAERVGLDTKFTASPEKAVQRAHELAEKMDKSGRHKKFTDFSIDGDGISLRVLHPQDKRAILLGYDTNCCFRPNGNADNSANNEYSLLQYCTTTPYGGVLECGKTKEQSDDFSKIYMGTPFLVNGNCMMFHSFETVGNQECEDNYQIVNELLTKAAIKAIEESQGDTKVVMITDLHKDNEGLNIDDKFNIGSFFQPYFGEQYNNYEEMYTNLDCNNILLAAMVGDKVLSGEELKNWCEIECHGDIEEVKSKLGLRLGERNKDYEFPERSVRFEHNVENIELVDTFKQEYDKLTDERKILALFNRKKQLEKKERY